MLGQFIPCPWGSVPVVGCKSRVPRFKSSFPVSGLPLCTLVCPSMKWAEFPLEDQSRLAERECCKCRHCNTIVIFVMSNHYHIVIIILIAILVSINRVNSI